MTASRRSALLGAGATLLSAAAVEGEALAAEPPAGNAAHLLQLSERANAALMKGDLATYRSLTTYTDDFTLMSPFGGEPTHASQLDEGRMQALGRFFRHGTFAQEVVQTYASPDMVTLVVIERTNAEVGGLPAQDWALRVTLVFQRTAGQWRLAHRHADPLVAGVSLQEAAALARARVDA